MVSPTKLMLVLTLPVYKTPSGLYIEDQACNGLRLWLENFDRVEFFGPEFEVDEPPPASLSVDQIVHRERLKIIPLPGTYSPLSFLRHLPRVARLLRNHMKQATHLHFAIAGIWGDWGSVAALVARREKRPYAVWTDQVASRVAEFSAGGRRGIRRLYWLVTARLLRPYERKVIEGAAVGLFHGADCYEAYARFSSAPHLVHDIHVPPEAAITAPQLDAKLASIEAGLRIVYVGRVHPEKGVLDWIEALRQAAAAGVKYQATWWGDGPLLDEAHTVVAAAGLAKRVHFAGSIEDRGKLLRFLRDADIFLFCHKIPESPRCLVEALICGTPLVGYHWPFAEELIAENGGGILTPRGDTAHLAANLAGLSVEIRRDLVRRASADGSRFNDEAVFRHRSELMKELLSRS